MSGFPERTVNFKRIVLDPFRGHRSFETLTKAMCLIYSFKKMNIPKDTKNFLSTIMSFRGSWLTGVQVKTL